MDPYLAALLDKHIETKHHQTPADTTTIDALIAAKHAPGEQ